MTTTYTPPAFAGQRPDLFWAWKNDRAATRAATNRKCNRCDGSCRNRSYTPPKYAGERPDQWFNWSA